MSESKTLSQRLAVLPKDVPSRRIFIFGTIGILPTLFMAHKYTNVKYNEISTMQTLYQNYGRLRRNAFVLCGSSVAWGLVGWATANKKFN